MFASVFSHFVLGSVSGELPEYAVHRGGESFYSYYLAFMTLGNMAGTLMAAHMKKYPLGRTVIVGFLFSSAA
ncbi:hypothetical protein [Caldibacillus debilis]|uniref:hypothetical protein n=1 Tax=Caldibacillus debilis TaxID=301148 RepID=UPI0023F2F33A|nr:hypothetical protein [Caldibacillus debilis]